MATEEVEGMQVMFTSMVVTVVMLDMEGRSTTEVFSC